MRCISRLTQFWITMYHLLALDTIDFKYDYGILISIFSLLPLSHTVQNAGSADCDNISKTLRGRQASLKIEKGITDFTLRIPLLSPKTMWLAVTYILLTQIREHTGAICWIYYNAMNMKTILWSKRKNIYFSWAWVCMADFLFWGSTYEMVRG